MNNRAIAVLFLLNMWSRSIAHTQNMFSKPVCGAQLPKAIEVICKGNYNGPSKKALGLQDDDTYDGIYPNYDEDNQLDFPFVQKRAANSLLGTNLAKKGIVEECCDKLCSFNEMRTYCSK